MWVDLCPWPGGFSGGSFSEDFATLSAMATLIILMNKELGRRVTCSLSLSSFGIRPGLLERVSGPARSFPRMCTSLRS